ncbi:hypothetical protein [Mesorhizobium sp. ANAO-SY3R2]|uniref:hypothetical protein n=1 Tax=Mesorhizobium sp. ANAO-SY3R2 TaxID=3166644 RepID=UPI00366EE33B
MFVARWKIDARFGHKQSAIGLMRQWEREIGPQAGADKMAMQILTGSIGAKEATIEVNHQVESLAQLEEFFAKLSKIDAHAHWGKQLEPMVVSGSSYWNIYRVVED